MVFQAVVRPLLFAISKRDPELAHELALATLQWLGRHDRMCQAVHQKTQTIDIRLDQELLGLHFSHPVGLAAGYDKNGVALHGLSALDFSFIEMGTVTPIEQSGNPRPRIFRFTKERALINRMGFPNQGAERVAGRLEQMQRLAVPLGISLGKGRDTPLELAVEDYNRVLLRLYAYGDYFAVNVSSPNTPGLRSLQTGESLDSLLASLFRVLSRCADARQAKRKPLLVKLAPDLEREQLDEVVAVCCKHQVDGFIATNTTTTRNGLRLRKEEPGGMSGRPLFDKAVASVRYLRQNLPSEMIIIGAGGISTAEDAYQMLVAGADLLQVFTGLAFEGPFLVHSINQGLLKLMERHGVGHIKKWRL